MSKECIDHYVGVIRGRLKDIEANAENLEAQLAKEKSAHDLTCKANVFAHQALEKLKAERDELEEAGRIMLGEALGDEAMINRLQAERDELQAEVARLRDKLADAPPQEPEPERLTVEDLDAAEVGSVLSAKVAMRERVKKPSGLWAVVGEVGLALPSRSLTTEGRTLTPPAPARRGRVVEPEELRVGDVMDVRKNGILVLEDKEVAAAGEWRDEEGWEFRLISRKPKQSEECPECGQNPRIQADRGV